MASTVVTIATLVALSITFSVKGELDTLHSVVTQYTIDIFETL